MNFELLVCVKVEREKFSMENYFGEDHVLALVERGSFVFDGGDGMESVGPLDAVCFEKGKWYKRFVTSPVTLYLFRYKADATLFSDTKIVFKDRERVRSIIRLLHKLNEEIYENKFWYRKILFSDLLMQYQIESQKSSVDNVEDEVIKEVLVRLNNTLHYKIDLQKLAEEYHFSYVQFSRRFKSAVGMTLQNYIAGLRMKKAGDMLKDTDLPVKQIACACGFSNEYYFSNFFKKYNHVSPTVYRLSTKQTT